jgi:hypothetical protein
MSLKTLDRTQWDYSEALAHVQNVTVARRANEVARQPPKPKPAHEHWNPPQDPAVAWKAEGEAELQVALRDGDLIAQGRYTEERTGWAQGSFSGFGLHSGYHTSIRSEQWREGKYSFGGLTARDWEFIEVRMPRFMVKAIWPDFVLPAMPVKMPEAPYSTPYLDLMQAAISRFGITAASQEKKENLSDWFLEQPIEGERISRNLADAMATLIRLPSAQRGGAKRVLGPDFRRAG